MSSKVQSTESAISSSPVHIGPGAKDHGASTPESLPPLEANAEALQFLESLRQEELQMLFFSETLAMVSNTGEPQGELTIDVQTGKHRDDTGALSNCPLVHAVSRGFIDKMLCGNSLLGYLSWNLETMEQHSQEFIKFHILPMERKMNLLKQENQLAMTRSIKEGKVCPEQEVKTQVTFLPQRLTAGFISESANLLLLRVMAWRRRVPSDARFLALDMEGKLCYSTYHALGSQTIRVDHQEAEAFIVEQTVHSEEGVPMSCQYFLLSDGHLAKRVQVGSPGCCMITKMPILREEDEPEPPPVFEKKPLMWEEDMELYSRFLDRKEQLRLSHARYLQEHPDAQAVISDFLLFLLLHKPADVVTFAAEHFGMLSVHWEPDPTLGSSNRRSPFRSLDPEFL